MRIKRGMRKPKASKTSKIEENPEPQPVELPDLPSLSIQRIVTKRKKISPFSFLEFYSTIQFTPTPQTRRLHHLISTHSYTTDHLPTCSRRR
jgi:hypothetical protein